MSKMVSFSRVCVSETVAPDKSPSYSHDSCIHLFHPMPPRFCLFDHRPRLLPAPRSTRGAMLGRPWAHWKGSTHLASRETNSWHSVFVRTSLNIIAPERLISTVRLDDGGDAYFYKPANAAFRGLRVDTRKSVILMTSW